MSHPIADRLRADLDRAAEEGLAALGDWFPEAARPLFAALVEQLGADHRPVYRLEPPGLVASPSGETRLAIRRIYRSSVAFVRDGWGAWWIGRSTRQARRSLDALVGVRDDIDSLPKLANL